MEKWFVEPYTSRFEAGDSENIVTQYPWLERFAPRKRLLKGGSYLFIKRLLDLLFIVVTSPAWALVLGLCALLIKLEEPEGVILFWQERTGKWGRRFRMYKFRTMVMNAEELKDELTDLNELQWPDFKITNDPRITKVGRILRKTSLDELPQIINVIRGDLLPDKTSSVCMQTV